MAWENICRRCGRCCYEKEVRGRKVTVNYRAPCRYLDESTRLCTVYADRFARCSECRKMTIFHALFISYLPPACGYVERFRPKFFIRPRAAAAANDLRSRGGEAYTYAKEKKSAYGRKKESLAKSAHHHHGHPQSDV